MTESEGVVEVCAVLYNQSDSGAPRAFQLSV